LATRAAEQGVTGGQKYIGPPALGTSEMKGDELAESQPLGRLRVSPGGAGRGRARHGI